MTVEPIRDKQKIKNLMGYLQGKSPKYALLFSFGLNTGLRVGDIIKVKISDIVTDKMQFKEYFVLKEKKTGKEKKIKLNESIKKQIKDFLADKEIHIEDYLFKSKKGGNISRFQAFRVLKKAATDLGIENFGTHSMRKTWGYWTYSISKYNIGLIMDTFNHSSQNITLRYIGINQDQKDELYSIVQF